MVLDADVNGETNVAADDVVDSVVDEAVVVVVGSGGAETNRIVDCSSEKSSNTYVYSTH